MNKGYTKWLNGVNKAPKKYDALDKVREVGKSAFGIAAKVTFGIGVIALTLLGGHYARQPDISDAKEVNISKGGYQRLRIKRGLVKDYKSRTNIRNNSFDEIIGKKVINEKEGIFELTFPNERTATVHDPEGIIFTTYEEPQIVEAKVIYTFKDFDAENAYRDIAYQYRDRIHALDSHRVKNLLKTFWLQPYLQIVEQGGVYKVQVDKVTGPKYIVTLGRNGVSGKEEAESLINHWSNRPTKLRLSDISRGVRETWREARSRRAGSISEYYESLPSYLKSS